MIIYETSNLLQYSPQQLSLLIDAVQMKIKDEQLTLAVRKDFSNGEDMSENLLQLNREAIKKCLDNLEDLFGLRVALLNAWTVVKKMEVIECN